MDKIYQLSFENKSWTRMVDAINALIHELEKQDALIETVKQMHEEDVVRIEALEKKFGKIEEVYPFGTDEEKEVVVKAYPLKKREIKPIIFGGVSQ